MSLWGKVSNHRSKMATIFNVFAQSKKLQSKINHMKKVLRAPVFIAPQRGHIGLEAAVQSEEILQGQVVQGHSLGLRQLHRRPCSMWKTEKRCANTLNKVLRDV